MPSKSFVKMIGLLLLLVFLGPLTFGLSSVAILLLRQFLRAHLRLAYGHSMNTPERLIEDCVLVWCCSWLSCCLLVQEAREVEFTSPKLAFTSKRLEF